MSSSRWILGTCLLLVWANLVVAQTQTEEPKKAIDLKPYEKFAEQIGQWIVKKEAKKFAEAIDTDVLFERALKGVEVSAELKKSFSEGGKQSIQSFPNQVIQTLSSGGSYKLLRVHVVDGEVRALFRMLADSAGVNYHDMVLIPNKDKGFAIADVYVVVSGEFFSQTMKRLLFDTLAVDPKKLKEGDISPATLDGIGRLRSLSELLKTQKHAELLTEWEKLPEAMKKDKGVFMFRFVAATALMDKDPKGYEKVMEDFQKFFPNDPTGDLILMDTWLIKKKYKEFQNSIDRLDKAVGGDPYLDVLRHWLQRREEVRRRKSSWGKCKRANPTWPLLTIFSSGSRSN